MIFILSVSYLELDQWVAKQALLIDIRSYNEYLAYHIPRSHPIHAYSSLPTHLPIIFICESGHKAKEYAIYYRRLFYQSYYLEGGIRLYLEMNKTQFYY